MQTPETKKPGAKLLADLKNREKLRTKKQPKETTMKKTIILTVTATLALALYSAGVLYAGAQLNQHYNDSVHAEAIKLSAQLAPSKQ